MSETAVNTVYAWLLVAPLLFAFLPVGRALIAIYVLGWSFLPIVVLDAPWVDLDKTSFVALAALLGVAVFGLRERPRFRRSWCDLPMLLWCIAPFFSSMANDLGPYDGSANCASNFLTWGVPYLLARAYLPWETAPRDVALGIVAGGLLYVPLCLLEVVLSPQLHRFVYGFHQHAFSQTIRDGGGFRPMVFMNHGLMVGLWMTCATLTAVVVWRSRAQRSLAGIPLGFVALALLVTAILCKSGGALALLVIGLTVHGLARRLGRWLAYALLACPVAYVVARMSGLWDARVLVDLAMRVSVERASSLQYRLDMELRLLARAWEHPWFGWGGFGRMFPPSLHDDSGTTVSDSLFIIVFGTNGIFGLACIMLVCAVPLLALGRRFSHLGLARADLAPAAALALCLVLYLIDGLFNMMVNPVYMLAAGAVTSYALAAEGTEPVTVRGTSGQGTALGAGA